MLHLNWYPRFVSAPLAVAGVAVVLALFAAPAAQAQPQPDWNGGPGYHRPMPPPYRPGDLDRGGPGYGRLGRAPMVRCESNNGRYKECRIPFSGPAVLVRQLSDTRCMPGRTYGTRRGRIWVSGGCRGDFAPR